MQLPLSKHEGRILDFDIENMPITYYAPDYPTAFITAIAWAFTDEPKNIEVRAITDPSSDEQYVHMLLDFMRAYNQADMVTGHYILKHDLPIIHGAMIESDVGGMEPKMVSDTKVHLVRFSAIPKNQEYLEAVLGTEQQKKHMTQKDWRDANRFKPKGIEAAVKRVTTDVKGHMQMRKQLVERGLLKPPVMWTP